MKIFLVLLVFSTTPAIALTEAQIRESVIKNFPLIQEAEMKFEASKAEITAAEGDFDTKLGFKSRNRIEDKYDNNYIETTLSRNTGVRGIGLLVGHRQGLGHFPAYDGKYQTSAAGELFAGISIPLLRNFSTDESRSNLEIAKIEKKQTEESLRLKQNIYIHKALSLYYKLLLEEKKFQIRKTVLDLALSRTEMLEKKFKSGDIEKIKLVDNQRSIAKRKDELLKSEIDIQSLRAVFSLYLPQQSLDQFLSNEPLDLAQKLEVPSPLLPPKLDLETLPQLTILEAEQRKLEVLEKLYKQQRLPGLGLEVLGAKELSSNVPYDPERIQVGVSFDYPLENRKASGKTVAQSYKLKALLKQREYTSNELARSYDYSLRAITLGKQRLSNVSEEVDNSLKMAQAEKLRWNQGSSDLFIVNLREQDVADAEIRKWSTYTDIKQAIIDAKLFSGSI